jgi:ADP-heptose:LPS heptosyltransferase
VAVVYLELLGDVWLWLPYGLALVSHLHSEGKEVIIVVDEAVKGLFNHIVDDMQVIGISRRAAFLSNPLSRWRFLRTLRNLRIDTTYYPVYPRGPFNWGESAVQAIGAPAWGFDAVVLERPWLDRQWCRRMYQYLIPSIDDVHQNIRQLAFLQAVGVNTSNVCAVNLPRPGLPNVKYDYWVLAPGASKAYRRWPKKNFEEIARSIHRLKPDLTCVIVGTKNEYALCAEIANSLFGLNVKNLAGATSVLELLSLITDARLLIGNDSSAGHIAAAVGTPSVIVTGGGHWERCFPYPPEAPIRKHPVAVGFLMPCFGCDWQCVHTEREDQPFPCIEGIRIESVMQAVENILNSPTHN